MVLHGVSGLSLVLLNIRALGHFLEYLCGQCQRQKMDTDAAFIYWCHQTMTFCNSESHLEKAIVRIFKL